MARFQSTLWSVIDAAREGNEHALQRFVERYRPPILAFLKQKGFTSEAEDLSQEVFLAIVRSNLLKNVDKSKGRFRALILSVTQNVIGTYLRRQGAKKRDSGRLFSLEHFDVAQPQQDDDFDREWATHLLRLSMERLQDENQAYFKALKMFVFEEKTYAEIMNSEGISKATLKNQIYRGKLKLAGYIREEVSAYCASHEEYSDEVQGMLNRISL